MFSKSLYFRMLNLCFNSVKDQSFLPNKTLDDSQANENRTALTVTLV